MTAPDTPRRSPGPADELLTIAASLIDDSAKDWGRCASLEAFWKGVVGVAPVATEYVELCERTAAALRALASRSASDGGAETDLAWLNDHPQFVGWAAGYGHTPGAWTYRVGMDVHVAESLGDAIEKARAALSPRRPEETDDGR